MKRKKPTPRDFEIDVPTPLDDSDLTDDRDPKSVLEELNSFMAGMAFRPRPASEKRTLEYYKNYVDPNGKVARVLAVVSKDGAGLDPDHPEYFAVTIQIHVKPTEEDIKSKCPAFCQGDLLHIISMFDSPITQQQVGAINCEKCGMQTLDFVKSDAGEKECFDCVRRSGKL